MSYAITINERLLKNVYLTFIHSLDINVQIVVTLYTFDERLQRGILNTFSLCLEKYIIQT